MSELVAILSEYDQSLSIALLEHLRLVSIALLLSVVIAVPLGIASWRHPRLAPIVIGSSSLVQTIPSIALFGLMIPLLSLVDRGIGALPATVALVLYGLLPIVHNTHAALRSVPSEILDAARGMGMSDAQIMRSVALPLALPGVLAGIRGAATMSIGVAAVAAYIGAGGLGQFISRGIATAWPALTLVGAIAIALLALLVEVTLGALERSLARRYGTVPRRRDGRPGR